MTKEELERERMFGTINLKMAMIQRQAMENECLKDENTELMAQIEKMKCCCNCERWRDESNKGSDDYPCIQHDCDSKCSLWELKK